MIKRDQYKCINSSSPDRSWPVLLQLWPQIKQQVPDATLTLAYGFKNWEFSAQHNKLHQDLIQKLKSTIKKLEPLGVRYIGRVSQKDLAKEYLSSGCWLYPTWFHETSCISAQEAQAAGLRIITSNIGALQTTVGSRGVLLDGDWTTLEYQNEFIKHAVVALNRKDNSDREILQKYAKDHFSLDALSTDWETMFYSLMEEFKTNPLVPYFPTPAYRTENSYKEEAKFTIVKQEQAYDPVASAKKVKLNIAAGPNVFPYDGWINYDREFSQVYFTQLRLVAEEWMSVPETNISANTRSWTTTCTPRQKQIIDYLIAGGTLEYKVSDVKDPFPQHPDNSVDIIYLGQMIEHLNPIYTIPTFLKECYRMLKPGGIIRLATPDLDLLIDAYRDGTLDKFAKEQPEFYKNADPASQLSYIMFGACGPDCHWNNYEGHMFLFNKQSMTVALNKAGFKHVEFFDDKTISHDPIIKHEVVDEGWSHSLVAEGTK